MRRAMVSILVVVMGLAVAVEAQLPETFSYQGLLKDETGEPAVDGEYEMTFRLYDADSGGAVCWEETQTVTVTHGVFSVQLGSQVSLGLDFDVPYWLGVAVGMEPELEPLTPLTSSPYSMFAGTVANGSITFEKLAEGAVTSEAIRDTAIRLQHLGRNGAAPWQVMKWDGVQWTMADDFGVDGPISAVYGEGGLQGFGSSGPVGLSVAPEGVAAHMLAPGSVTTDKIEDGTMDFTEFGQNGALEGYVISWSGTRGAWNARPDSAGVQGVSGGAGVRVVGHGQVTIDLEFSGNGVADSVSRSDHHHDTTYVGQGQPNSVTSTMIGQKEIKNSNIDSLAVTKDKLGSRSVSSAKLDSLAVTKGKLQARAVSTAKLDSLAVTKGKLQARAVSSAKLDTLAVTKGKLAQNAVASDKIEDRSIGFVDMAQNDASPGDVMMWSGSRAGWVDTTAVTGVNAGTGLTGGGVGAVTLDVLFGGTGVVDSVARSDHDHDEDYIWEGEPSSITSEMIANYEIQSVDLDSLVVTTGKLDNGSVTSAKLGFSSVTGDKLGAAAVTAAKLDTSAVTTEKLDSGAVTSEKIGNGTIGFVDIGQNSANPGQVMKWTGTAWAARNDSVGTGGGGPNGWADDGNYVRLLTVTDSVGIGTAIPGVKLDVEGEIRSSGKASFGSGNTNSGAQAFAAGESSTASGDYSTVSGGFTGSALGDYSFVGGGRQNVARGDNSVVAGGGGTDPADTNSALGHFSVVGGGSRNVAGRHDPYSPPFVWPPHEGSHASVVGGAGNIASGTGAAVTGGVGNRARGYCSVVSGGAYEYEPADTNVALGPFCTVGGGASNTAGRYHPYDPPEPWAPPESGAHATIAGGGWNIASGTGAFVGGGISNVARGDYSVIGGGGGYDFPDTNFAYGSYCVIGGGSGNAAGPEWPHFPPPSDSTYATIGGGRRNSAVKRYTTIAGGYRNTAGSGDTGDEQDGQYATVAGGAENVAYGRGATVGGGRMNAARGHYSVVAGGGGYAHPDTNAALGNYCVVSGGSGNRAGMFHPYDPPEYLFCATVGGGWHNEALGHYSTIPGGAENQAMGQYSFAAGRGASAQHDGSFVWSDGNSGLPSLQTSGDNQFLIEASGGVGIGTNTPSAELHVQGRVLMDEFEMHPGAYDGYVLTSDSLGVGTWQHSSGGGFSLPYNGSWGGSGAAFEVVNNDSNGEAVKGRSTQGAGLYGSTTTGTGVYATALSGDAVHAVNSGSSGYGVLAQSSYGTAVRGESDSGTAVYGESNSGYAGEFSGNVTVSGTLSKGGGSFKIDHPLDPKNKYLYHSFVESPDMMNVYNGNAVLDEDGEATVEMPEWFETLNTDFRYQLTCIGGFAPVYVAEEINGNAFRIAGGEPGLKVSWQVTGIRDDAFAQANRIPVEEVKPKDERGKYLHPEAFGR